jgi:hypothetical protein
MYRLRHDRRNRTRKNEMSISSKQKEMEVHRLKEPRMI